MPGGTIYKVEFSIAEGPDFGTCTRDRQRATLARALDLDGTERNERPKQATRLAAPEPRRGFREKGAWGL